MGISTVLPVEEIPSITIIYMIGVASLPAENAKTVLICIMRFFSMANLVEVAVHRSSGHVVSELVRGGFPQGRRGCRYVPEAFIDGRHLVQPARTDSFTSLGPL